MKDLKINPPLDEGFTSWNKYAHHLLDEKDKKERAKEKDFKKPTNIDYLEIACILGIVVSGLMMLLIFIKY